MDSPDHASCASARTYGPEGKCIPMTAEELKNSFRIATPEIILKNLLFLLKTEDGGADFSEALEILDGFVREGARDLFKVPFTDKFREILRLADEQAKHSEWPEHHVLHASLLLKDYERMILREKTTLSENVKSENVNAPYFDEATLAKFKTELYSVLDPDFFFGILGQLKKKMNSNPEVETDRARFADFESALSVLFSQLNRLPSEKSAYPEFLQRLQKLLIKLLEASNRDDVFYTRRIEAMLRSARSMFTGLFVHQ